MLKHPNLDPGFLGKDTAQPGHGEQWQHPVNVSCQAGSLPVHSGPTANHRLITPSHPRSHKHTGPFT